MTTIFLAVSSMGVLCFLFAFLLAVADKNLRVEEDPRVEKVLEALPGVGRKTANVILHTAFGQPTIAVDTHIFRVGNRTKLAPGKTPLEVEKKLLKIGVRTAFGPAAQPSDSHDDSEVEPDAV